MPYKDDAKQREAVRKAVRKHRARKKEAELRDLVYKRSICGSCHNCKSTATFNPLNIKITCSEDLEIIKTGDNRDCYKYDSEGNYYE